MVDILVEQKTSMPGWDHLKKSVTKKKIETDVALSEFFQYSIIISVCLA